VQKWYVEQKNQGCVAGSQIQQALAFFIEALRTAVFLDFSSTSSTTTTDKIIRPKQEQQQQQQQQQHLQPNLYTAFMSNEA
jgi:dsRNA-specific ribonuclease